MSKKALIGIIAVLLFIVIIQFFSLVNKSSQIGQADNISAPVYPSPKTDQVSGTGRQITVDGWIFCLPPVNTADTACVIGIEDATKKFYGLIDQSGTRFDPVKYVTGTRQTISGTLVNDADVQKNYRIDGTIQTQ